MSRKTSMQTNVKSESVRKLTTRAEPDKSRSKQSDSTFNTAEQAAQRVNPVLFQVRNMIRRDHLSVVPNNLRRLGQTLIREERGFYGDTRTPLFKSMSYATIAAKIVSMVKQSMGKVSGAYSSIPGFAGTLLEVEAHQAEKISDRGHFPPAHIWMPDKLNEIYEKKSLSASFNSKAWDDTLKWVSELVPAHSLDVKQDSWKEGLSPEKSSSFSPLNPDSNSGYPDYVRKWYHTFRRDATAYQWLCQMYLTERVKVLWKRFIKAESWKECTLHLVGTAFQRTNVGSGWKLTKDNTYKGKPMSKLRAVIGVDKRDTILGKPILNRLIEACKEIRNPDGSSMFSALKTPQVVDKTMQVMLATAEKHGLTVLSTDFSGFDASINPALMFQVAKAVSNWMTPRMANIFLGLVYSEFFQCCTISPYKIYPEAPSAMKSGTIFTNILDSLYNLASQKYGEYAGHYKKILCHNVQGDDATMVGFGINPETFEKATSELGLVGNSSKQYFVPHTLAFCQKIHVYGYPGGIYPIARTTASITSVEDDVGLEVGKNDKGGFAYVLAYRTVCRLEPACFNPNFVQYVNLIAQEDRMLHLGREISAAALAKAAGSYAEKYETYYKDFPWKSIGSSKEGFARSPVNRVLRGELPPPPGVRLWEWVYGESYADLAI